jgi:hypothetical protein
VGGAGRGGHAGVRSGAVGVRSRGGVIITAVMITSHPHWPIGP